MKPSLKGSSNSIGRYGLPDSPKRPISGAWEGKEGFDMRVASPEDPQALVADPPSPTDEVLVSVVVPTYREADNLPLLMPRITAALEPWPHEIVDDDSNDGTDQAVARAISVFDGRFGSRIFSAVSTPAIGSLPAWRSPT